MRFRPVRALLTLVFVSAVGGWFPVGLSVGAANVSKQQADTFVQKLDRINRQEGARSGTQRTPVTEGELNSWFVYHSASRLPAGVTAPQLTIVGDGKVAGQAVVDLEVLGKRRSTGGAIDPWSFLTGKVPVRVVGALRTVNGVGRFDMESADVSGVPVPKPLLQQLVSYYSRSSSRPDGLSLDAEFPLPANIRTIEVGQGQAVVVQ